MALSRVGDSRVGVVVDQRQVRAVGFCSQLLGVRFLFSW